VEKLEKVIPNGVRFYNALTSGKLWAWIVFTWITALLTPISHGVIVYTAVYISVRKTSPFALRYFIPLAIFAEYFAIRLHLAFKFDSVASLLIAILYTLIFATVAFLIASYQNEMYRELKD
jgi:hypothetical protein